MQERFSPTVNVICDHNSSIDGKNDATGYICERLCMGTANET